MGILSTVAGYISLLAAGQGAFLALLLFARDAENRGPNRVLAALLCAWSIVLFGTALGASGLYRSLPHLIRIGEPMVLLLGPLFLMYTTAIRRGRAPRIQWLHLLPCVAYAVSLLPFYFASSESKIQWVEVTLASAGGPTVGMPVVAHALLYCAVTLWVLRQHEGQVEGFAPDLPETALRWLREIALAFVVVAIFALSGYTFALLNGQGSAAVNWLTGGVMAVALYILGFRGLNAAQLFGDRDYPAWIARTPFHLLWGVLRFERKNISSGAGGDREQRILEKLKNYMETHKPYLDPDLSLPVLSERSGVPRYLVSRLVNRDFARSFSDWVTEYRIREMQAYLCDPANGDTAIMELAFAAGFNSKTAFNTAFRRIVGESPSEYRAGCA